MPRLVPYSEQQGLSGALLEADGLGRALAHNRAASDLAKVAGALLARREEHLYEMEKAARLMLETGLLTEEEFEMEKAAAWAGMSGLFGKARAAASGLKSRIGGLFRRKPGPFDPKKAATGWSAGPKVGPVATEAAEAAVKPAVKPAAKGFGWGSALPWMAAGGIGYGLYKGVPWAARQLEQTSTTPMAHGLGWSPVPYGYGYNPYGSGVQTMGPGA